MTIKFEDLMPTDPLAQIGWVDCLRWAMWNHDVIGQFMEDTGLNANPIRSPLDAMIDRATGFNEHVSIQFVIWFNQNIWGAIDGRGCNGDETEPESVE